MTRTCDAGNHRRTNGTVSLERAFPQYTPTEAIADRAIHLLAVPAAIGAVGWLLLTAHATERNSCDGSTMR